MIVFPSTLAFPSFRYFLLFSDTRSSGAAGPRSLIHRNTDRVSAAPTEFLAQWLHHVSRPVYSHIIRTAAESCVKSLTCVSSDGSCWLEAKWLRYCRVIFPSTLKSLAQEERKSFPVEMDNLSAVLHGIGDLRMTHYPPKEPGAGEAQIKVHNCGVCMTDVHILDHGSVGNIVVTSPYVPGHEFSGVVSKVGPDVTSLRPGDRVTVDNLVACGFCVQCKRACSNTCFNHTYIGFPPNNGGLTRLGTFPAQIIHKIPDTMDLEEAAMMEPLSVCVNAANRADVTLNDNVIVFGAGPIGLMTLQVVRARGAAIVCVADVKAERLELARQLGVTHTVLFREDETDALTNAQKLRDELGEDVDIAIECSGVPLCLQTSIYVVRPAGVVAVLGFGPDDATIPINNATLREIDIRGCVCNNYNFPSAIKLVASQKVKVKPIISHRFPLKDLPRALDLVRDHQVVKAMIDCASE